MVKSEQTQIITPKTIFFPETAKAKFIAYVQENCGEQNPYVDFESKRYALAMKMHDILTKVAMGVGEEAENAKELLQLAETIRNSKESPPVLVKNFPVDTKEDLVAPPTNHKDFSTSPPEKTGKKTYITEWSLEAFNTLCGLSPIQSKEMQAGNRYHRVIPQKGLEKTKTNSGAEILDLHTEATYRQDNNMQIILVGLRNKKTPTMLVPIDEVQRIFNKKFDEEELQLLEKPIYKTVTDPTFTSNGKCIRQMLVRDSSGKFREMQMNGNMDRLNVDEDAANEHGCNVNVIKELIAKVSSELAKINQGVILGHGDLIVFNNLKALHARTPIHADDRKAGEERHLIRTQSYRDKVVVEEINQKLGVSR